MPTKQDFDRAIKGTQDRIVTLRKREKKLFTERKRISKMPVKTQVQADAVTTARVNHSTELKIVQDGIHGNLSQLRRDFANRELAPSSFKTLKTDNANKHNVRELQLFIENDSTLHRQQGEPIIKNLTKKAEKGTFDVKGAAKLYKNFADTGAKKYGKDFGSGDGFKIFSVDDRNKVAINLANDFKEENISVIRKGNRNLLSR